MPTIIEELKQALTDKTNPVAQWNIAIEALRHAAHGGHIDVVQFLIIEEYVDINDKYMYGSTALIDACIAGHIEIARFLILNGADVDTQTESGLTALMWACKVGNRQIAKMLMYEGKANINLLEQNGNGAFDFVIASHHTNKASLMKLFSNSHAMIAAHNEAKELAVAIEAELTIQGKARGNSDLTEYSTLTVVSSYESDSGAHTSLIESLLPRNNHNIYNAHTELTGDSYDTNNVASKTCVIS